MLKARAMSRTRTESYWCQSDGVFFEEGNHICWRQGQCHARGLSRTDVNLTGFSLRRATTYIIMCDQGQCHARELSRAVVNLTGFSLRRATTYIIMCDQGQCHARELSRAVVNLTGFSWGGQPHTLLCVSKGNVTHENWVVLLSVWHYFVNVRIT